MDVSNYYGYGMGMKMGWRALVNTVMYDLLAARVSKQRQNMKQNKTKHQNISASEF
jgi:hypothetical protein